MGDDGIWSFYVGQVEGKGKGCSSKKRDSKVNSY